MFLLLEECNLGRVEEALVGRMVRGVDEPPARVVSLDLLLVGDADDDAVVPRTDRGPGRPLPSRQTHLVHLSKRVHREDRDREITFLLVFLLTCASFGAICWIDPSRETSVGRRGSGFCAKNE